MDTKTWSLAMRYYNACWTDFDYNKLTSLFADDVEHVYVWDNKETVIKGKENVSKLFKENWFDLLKNITINKFEVIPDDKPTSVSILTELKEPCEKDGLKFYINVLSVENLHFNEVGKIKKIEVHNARIRYQKM